MPKSFRILSPLLALGLAACQSTTALAPASNDAGYPLDIPQLTCADYGTVGGRAKLIAHRVKPGAAGYIEYRARREQLISSGHMYVVFGRLDPNGNPVTFQYTGLYPTGGAVGMYSAMAVPIKAYVTPREHDCTQGTLAAYRVDLTESEYQALLGKVRAKLAKPPLWHMFGYNCNHYAAELGRVAGLRPAIDFISPTVQYIHSFIAINGDTGKGV
ncbi:MAG: hypothetical protein KF723_18715 [Rhizobiaceae bacterium]|nr:hypothetical protein [Rhizobiaceae bacterium]